MDEFNELVMKRSERVELMGFLVLEDLVIV